ncbi:MAG: GAF domain-containing protein [Pseudomonadota bacterium]
MEAIAARHVAETFASRVALLWPATDGALIVPRAGVDPARCAEADVSVAQWVYDHGHSAGLGADALPGADAAYLPLAGSQRALGVLVVLPSNRRRILLPEQHHLLETFAGQIALAVERSLLPRPRSRRRSPRRPRYWRNTLLASISHDLRTPLAVIAAAGSTLADDSLALDAQGRARLANSIVSRTRDMTLLISNVLDPDALRDRRGAAAPGTGRCWRIW